MNIIDKNKFNKIIKHDIISNWWRYKVNKAEEVEQPIVPILYDA